LALLSVSVFEGILKFHAVMDRKIARFWLFIPEGVVTSAKIADASDIGAIKEAARIIHSGGLVAFPTETVYGLGADAGNAHAVVRIFEVKARPRIDPLIIHVADPEGAQRYGNFPKSAAELMTRFWPGPLTLIVDKNPSVPPIVTAGLETVAIRVPAHPAALALIRETGCGIAAPSANPFGYVSPTEAQHVAEQLGDSIDLILDGGPCAIGLESTILSLASPTPSILRAGGTAIEELESILGKLDILTHASHQPHAPGQLIRHYATHTRLEIAEEILEELNPAERVGLLSLIAPANPKKYDAVEVLSPSGDLREAAANLFRALRRLDSLSLDKIIARPVREEGIGRAIMDRLRRCSEGKSRSQDSGSGSQNRTD
jgi:L-threonylcarbamoyladenylate synthase